MTRFKTSVRAGRSGRRPASRPAAVRRALRESLVASGDAPARVLPTYEITMGSPADRIFQTLAAEQGLVEIDYDGWPCDLRLGDDPVSLFRDGAAAVYRLGDGTYALVSVHQGWARVAVASNSRDSIATAFGLFHGLYPASYLIEPEDPRVPVTFWTDGKWGPVARLRKLEASPWSEIRENYSTTVCGELDDLMAWDDGPGRDGQLLLWQGPPGTGKTWVLRALASEWSRWAEFHYITDPDAFFVENPSYMIDVLLADSYEAIDPSSGEIVTETDSLAKWRVLILEDTGELLSAGAKEKYGQGLSRLLNVVDGMIGQGLRVLALVTTNDELDDLNPATTRPGRCASQIVFGPLSEEEARTWSGDESAGAGTIAELFSRYGRPATDPLEETEPLEESLAAAASSVVDEVRRVAESYADAAVGYGETAFDSKTGTVYRVVGDWTDCENGADDFLAIDGVTGYEHEHESLPDGWWEADVVYPENPPRWVTERPEKTEAALAETVALAAKPLEL